MTAGLKYLNTEVKCCSKSKFPFFIENLYHKTGNLDGSLFFYNLFLALAQKKPYLLCPIFYYIFTYYHTVKGSPVFSTQPFLCNSHNYMQPAPSMITV